jgi:hypothetical protein
MDVTGITISRAALHAALTRMRDLGFQRDNEGDAAAYMIDAANVLIALFDPAHASPAQPQGLARRLVETGKAAAAAEMRPPEAATASLAPSSQAGTPAPPTIDGAGSPWKPIATAPRQEAVLVCRSGLLGWWCVACCSALGEWQRDGGLDPLPHSPSHWQPLETPPTIDLPAGPDGAAIPVAHEPPAADGAPPAPEAPPPAQAAEGRPAGTITRRGTQSPRTPPAARHAPPADRPQGRKQRITLTPDQEAKLRELWPAQGVNGNAIRAAINAIGEPQVTNDGTLYSIAHRLGLGVRSALWAEAENAAVAAVLAGADHSADAGEMVPAATPEAAQPADPAPIAQPDPQPDPPPAPPHARHANPRHPLSGGDLPGEAGVKAEVFEAFDAGSNVRNVAADFGIAMSTLSNWHAEWKLAQRRQESAA